MDASTGLVPGGFMTDRLQNAVARQSSIHRDEPGGVWNIRSSEMMPPLHPVYPPTLGARQLDDGACEFRVWAPKASQLELHLVAPEEQLIPMPRGERGYHILRLDRLAPETRYF